VAREHRVDRGDATRVEEIAMSTRTLRGSRIVIATAALASTLIGSSAPRADEPPARSHDLVTRPLSSSVTSSMSTVRWLHIAARLPDGRVLIAGGSPDEAAFKTGEIYDPATGAWTPTGTPMLYAHDWPIAASLCDGRVFVGGRRDANAHDAEIYDPAVNAWIDAGKMKLGHVYGTATLLQDCRLLLVGGYNANTQAEVYNPATKSFKAVGVMNTERFFHTTTVLADGRALAAGGGVDVSGQWFTYATADLFDPKTGLWTKAAKMHHPRRAHTATLLTDGTVLVAGGTTGGKDDGTEGGTQLSTAELYDPATDTWKELPSHLVTARTFHTAALVPGGAVLLFGGLDGSGSASRQVEGYLEGMWQALDPLLIDRYQHASALLDDGSVLVTGGVHQATAELYRLAPKGQACTSNLTCDGGHCVDGTCCNEACDSGCRRCDIPGKEGTCTVPCADETHALTCSDGTTTCANDACIALACGVLRCDGEAGACLTKCTSVIDCAPGYACDLSGACVPPPDVSGVDTGACSAAALDQRRSAGASVAMILAAMALTRRRARRRLQR
jgi:Kelch motif protein